MTRFSDPFRQELVELMRWRRDVRRFRTDPVDEALLDQCLSSFLLAPSVGLSEPWRLVRIETKQAKQAALDNFSAANARALDGYEGEKSKLYSQLKLSGMRQAPVQLAVFCDESTQKGSGLGAATMPEMRRYSVVAAITQFWLVARAHGLGVGWVSILDPERLCRDLNISEQWVLVAYLCVGVPEQDDTAPELEKSGWEHRDTHLRIEQC